MKLPAIIAVLVWVLISPAASAAPQSLTIAVVGADPADPRRQAIAEAIEFWNMQFAEIGAGVRLGPINAAVQLVPDSALVALSESVVGPARSGTRATADFPAELTPLPGDIIVALSTADFVSFGRPVGPGRKGLVGLSRPDIPPRSLPNVMRNLVAHELGHVLGLRHNDDPAMLMCGRPAPCRPGLFASNTKRFFPLTAADKAALRGRWPPQ